MAVPAVRRCFWPNTAECLGPWEPEHYRDEERIQHLFFHISGLLVRTVMSRCCSITFDARGVVHFSSCHRKKQLTSLRTEKHCNIGSQQWEQVGEKRGQASVESFITIMFRLTRPKASGSIRPKITSLTESGSLRHSLFLKLNKVVKGTHFENVETIERAVTMDSWKKRMKTCIGLKGDYFEGEKV